MRQRLTFIIFLVLCQLTNAQNEIENLIEESKKLSTRLIETENRYRVDFDGRGTALDFPVIYLGLKRLIPLATEKTINLQDFEMANADKNQFAKLLPYQTRSKF